MSQFKNYQYDEKEISSLIVDASGSNFVWIAFKKNDEGNCLLKKVSANDPSQIYYTLEIATNEITKLKISNDFLYLALDDSSNIGKKYSLTQPLTNYTDIELPSGINEAPIDLIIDGSFLYYLIPGNISGEIAKIVKMTTNGTFLTTIDLEDGINFATNAVSFLIDNVGLIWVVTKTNPTFLIKVEELSGETFNISFYS